MNTKRNPTDQNRAAALPGDRSRRHRLPGGGKRWLSAALCAAMILNLAACEQKETPSGVSSQVPAPSSSAPESSAPESSEFVPSEDLIPSEAPSSGAEDFQTAFSQNPIDKQYDDDYAVASSFSMMREACDTAAKSWKNMIDTAFRAALDTLTGDDRTALQDEQNQWADELDQKVEQLRADAGDTNDGILESSRQIVLLYRERAMELCKVVYDATGELPAFETSPEDDGTPKG